MSKSRIFTVEEQMQILDRDFIFLKKEDERLFQKGFQKIVEELDI